MLFLWIRCTTPPTTTTCEEDEADDAESSGEEYFIKHLNPESTVQIHGTETFKTSVKDMLTQNVEPHLDFKINFVESEGNVVIHDIHQGGGIIKCMTSHNPRIKKNRYK